MTTEDEHQKNSLLALNLVNASVPALVLKTMIELDVFEIIKKAGQASAADIVAALPAASSNPDAAATLDRLLRLMASYSVLAFSLQPNSDGGTEMVYELGPLGKFLTKNEDGFSYAGFSLFLHDQVFLQVWDKLKDAIIEGGTPFIKKHEMSIYEYMGSDSRFTNDAHKDTVDHGSYIMRKVLDTYKGFDNLSSLVDVGGGRGSNISMIVSKYPTIKGINYDLPYAIKDAPSYPGVEHVAGNMYDSVPKADAIFMRWVIHTTTDEQSIELLKNCHAALPDHGKVIICETIVPDVPEPSEAARRAYTMDTLMLTFSGGKERTIQDYEALGKQAGFNDFKMVCWVSDYWVMEYIKN